MIFTELAIPGVYLVELERRSDSRGFFARTYCEAEFEQHGLASRMVQTNVSYNMLAGTIRGMHRQLDPYGEVKLVRATRGGIYDVAVDMRPGSPTFHHYVGVELTDENHSALYVPNGFAHGYQALTDGCEVLYQVSTGYAAGYEQGYRYDDPLFGIQWPIPVSEISEKDLSWPFLNADLK